VLTDGLSERYGDIFLKHGPVINYLGMALDIRLAGAVQVTLAEYNTSFPASSDSTYARQGRTV
jgi:hypothetical protein